MLPLVASAATFTSQLDYTGLENKADFADVPCGRAWRDCGSERSPGFLLNGDVIVTLYSVQSLLVNNVTKAFDGRRGACIRQTNLQPRPVLLSPRLTPTRSCGGERYSRTVQSGIAHSRSLGHAECCDRHQRQCHGTALLLAANIERRDRLRLRCSPGRQVWPQPVLKLFNLTRMVGSSTMAANVTNGTDLTGYESIAFPSLGNVVLAGASTMSFALVPEPGTIALWGAALAIGAVVTYRRRKQS